MGIFSQNSKLKAPAPVIRREVVAVDKPKPRPKLAINGLRNPSSTNSLRVPSPANRSRLTPSASPRGSPHPPSSSSADGDTRDRKRKLPTSSAAFTARKHRPSPVGSDRVTFESDSESEDDSDWVGRVDGSKRQKRDRAEDVDRVLAHKALIASTLGAEGAEGTLKFRKKENGERKTKELRILHAADAASIKDKCTPLWNAKEDEVAVELQYPGSKERERYELVTGKDTIDTVREIKFVVRNVPEVYFDEETAETFRTISRQIERASSDTIQDLASFKAALSEFNDRIRALHADGSIARSLANKHDLPRDFVKFIIGQVYDRIVAPHVELLRKYENGSDNVYGELLHPFVSTLLIDHCQMTSSQVFVDLGSGVGNVVFQAALEIGCESWGCEMMKNCCDLADKQKPEFEGRCRLWGLRHGRVTLLRNDFTLEPKIQEVLKRADVVLVNNQVFTSNLNDTLVQMFLDLKPGCKVISLRSFQHESKSAVYNENDVASSIFDVEKFDYPKDDSVSWTGSSGKYCISTRK